MLILLLLVYSCLNIYSCFDINPKQNRNVINNKVQELEELLIKYSFYKNHIIDNDLSIKEYYDILFPYIEEMEKDVDYLYSEIDECIDAYNFSKFKILINVVLKETSELINYLNE
jgi:hypothetical protein